MWVVVIHRRTLRLVYRATFVSMSACFRLMSNALRTMVPPPGREMTNGSVRAGQGRRTYFVVIACRTLSM